MSKSRRLAVALITASLVMSVAVPAASAATKPPTLKSLNKKLLTTTNTAKSARTRATAARRAATRLGNSLANLTNRVKTAEGTLAAAPALITGLTQLADVVQNQIAPGLQQLATAAQALGDNYLADEFGVVQMTVPDDAVTPADADSNPDPIPGCFYESPNIPDSVQQSVVSGQCIVPPSVTGSDRTLRVLAGIRSNEVDGTGASDPAGSARIVALHVRALSGSASGQGATPQPGPGQPPVVNIPFKSPEVSTTETSFPFQLISTDQTVDLLTNNYSGTPPVVTPGDIIYFTIGFFDLTPASPDPKQ